MSRWLFQSTRPRGARPCCNLQLRRVDAVSIHAPAWGATSHRFSGVESSFKFQSTRPRGARPADTRHPYLVAKSFNPRARVGRDFGRLKEGDPAVGVSIHAPAWGATP